MGKLKGKEVAIFLTLFFIGLVANLDKSLIGVAATAIRGEYGYSATEFANITNLYYASNIVMTLVSGWIVDRFGYKPFMVTALSILTVASLTFGLSGMLAAGAGGAVGVLTGLLASRFFIGIGQTGYTNGVSKVIVENFPSEVRQTVQSVVVATAGLGALLSYTVFTGLVSVGWQLAYYVLSALFFVALVLMVVIVPKKYTPPAGSVSLFTAWKHKNSLILGFALLCNNMVGVVSLAWLPSYLQSIDVIKAEMAVNPGLTNMILIGYAIVMGVAMVASNFIIKAWFRGKEKVFAVICSAIGAVLLFMMTTSQDLAAIVAFLYGSTFLLMLVFSAIVALPYAPLANEDGTIVPVSMIASSYAVINIMAFLGAIIGNTAVAGIADAMGFSVGFASLAVPFLLSGLALFLLPKTK